MFRGEIARAARPPSRFLLPLLAVLCAPAPRVEAQGESAWKPLFNGKDLEGWDSFLAPEKGAGPRGLNNDPDHVFSVVRIDGAQAIRVSGQGLGGLTTREEFEGFHLRLEFKWGKLTWPPRKDLPRDSGILYYSIGPPGAGSGGWMKSVESNVMEEDCGSFWSVAGTIVDIEVGEDQLAYREDPKTPFPVYQKGGRLKTAGPGGGDGVRPRPIVATPTDRWNTAEVIAVGGDSIHLFNGQVTMVLRNARHAVGEALVPLLRGKIQLQSEWAEVYYRKIEVRPLKEFPQELRDWVAVGPEGEEGFTPLLDEPHLKEWVQCGPGSFGVKDGVATGTGGMGLWYYRGRQFGDFVLRGEYLKEPGGDSGVFLRFPEPGNDPWVAVKQGHEMEIGEDKPQKGSTGSIYPFQGPTYLPLKPAGEWNAYQIRCAGRTYEVSLNGRLVNRFFDTTGRPLRGYLGLQNYPYQGAVRHRNLRVKALSE
jgi:hypothetical protein